jgi:hypothetical protein
MILSVIVSWLLGADDWVHLRFAPACYRDAAVMGQLSPWLPRLLTRRRECIIMKRFLIVAPICMTLQVALSGLAAADSCEAYHKASLGYADALANKSKYMRDSQKWCFLHLKAQEFAKKAAVAAPDCKSGPKGVVEKS